MEDCLYTANKGIDCRPAPPTADSPPPEALARSMREQLSGFLNRLETGEWPLLPLSSPSPWV